MEIQAAGFEAEGVELIAPTEADFDERAGRILGRDAGAILELKPYLAIVSNRSARTVVAYTVSWTVALRNESTEVRYTQFQFPDAVAGTTHGLSLLEGREIETGEARLVGMGFEVWPPEYMEQYGDYGGRAIRELGEVKHLRIALDAVIFDDGTLLGVDEAHLAEHFIAFVQAKQMAYRDIVVELENGYGSGEVLATLRERVTQAARPGALDPLEGYGRKAAAEVLSFHDRVVLEVFRRAMRREAFSIRRAKETGG